jgi:tetratricopeptide (TPR) repeat protein
MNTGDIKLRKWILCIGLLVVGIGNVQAQSKKIKSLPSKKEVASLVAFYLDSAQLLANKAPLRAIDNINKAIELSIGNNDKTNEALSYQILGNIQQNLDQHDLAVENYKKCINTLAPQQSGYNSSAISKRKVDNYEKSFSLAGEQRFSQQLFYAYKSMAFSLLQLNKVNEADITINRCFDINFSTIPNSDKLEARRIQASILLKQGKSEESLNSLMSTLEEEKKQTGVATGEIKTLIAIASLYQQTKRETKAVTYYQQAKELGEKVKNFELLVSINNALAQIFRQQKNAGKELEARMNTMEISNTISKELEATNESSVQAMALRKEEKRKGQLDIESDFYDEKLIQDNIQEPLFSKSDDLENTANTYKLRAEDYLRKGDNMQALKALQQFIAIQDSIKNTRKRELDQALKVSIAVGQNQQRIDLLEKERSLNERSIEILKQDKELREGELYTRNIIIGTLLFLIVFMLGGSYSIFKSFREKRKANQLLAIKSLRGQMNPHFIFNALNAVNHYISQNDELAANRYLSDFSKLMRAVMETSKHDFISLTEELDILKLYLQLEHARFKDQFDYTFKIDEDVDTSEFELPPMLIQPYIENAVWHGLRYLDGKKGLLRISISRTTDDLLIVIADNGIGRKRSLEIKTKNQKLQNSTGMQNIESRITIMNQLYKTNIRVVITDTDLTVLDAGTHVEIFIPKKINSHA